MAEKRRQALLEKRRKRLITLLCIVGGLGASLLSFAICVLVYGIGTPEEAVPEAEVSALPYDAAQPFSIADLTPSQLKELNEKKRLSLSDGPRGISIGDSLDTILERYPSSFSEKAADSELTGEQSDELQILYCADYFRNTNGKMTILPPRGLLSVDSGEIIVTLLSPTMPYPAGTREEYGMYPHLFCIYTINPDTMTVSSIVLGTDT
jgi:hypothetical protein